MVGRMNLSVALARAASPCTCAEWTRLIGHSWHAPDCPVPIEFAYRERVLALEVTTIRDLIASMTGLTTDDRVVRDRILKLIDAPIPAEVSEPSHTGEGVSLPREAGSRLGHFSAATAAK
jgi:hypothetical protein